MDFLTKAPTYFKNICMEVRNDAVTKQNKKTRMEAAQAVINKMKNG